MKYLHRVLQKEPATGHGTGPCGKGAWGLEKDVTPSPPEGLNF